MNTKRTGRISRSARAKIVELASSGLSSYQITNYLNRRRYRPPRGDRWQRVTVRLEMKRLGVYKARPTFKTSTEAVDTIVRLAREGRSIPETIQSLEAAGLKPAKGSSWSMSTISRIRIRHGVSAAPLSARTRFDRHVELDEETGCLRWTGRLHDGYGHFEVGGHNALAHRWNWEQHYGPLPAGHHLHHTCRQTNCVNTAHLVPVPASQHKTLEREEARINSAVLSGQLDADIDVLRESDEAWPGWPEAESRVGALRPAQVTT